MANLALPAGATSQTIPVFIQDTSRSDGGGLTGLVYNASGLQAYYALPRAAAVQITLATLGAVTSAYSSGGFIEIDATNLPGWYRFDLPDAAIASGPGVAIHFRGATNMAETPIELQLTTLAFKRNTAIASFSFPMRDVAGALKTGETVTLTRSLDGGAFGAGTIGSVTEIGTTGIYKADLGAGDLDGVVVVLKATSGATNATVITIVTQS